MYKNENPLIEAKHIIKQYPISRHSKLTACNDVSLNFYQAQTLGVVGESGCGKSTLMRMVVGLEKPTSGEILFQGKNITELKGENLRLNRRNIQMVFQDPVEAFHPRMKVKEIICEPLLNFKEIKRRDIDVKANELLKLVELSGNFADRYPHEMSGGQRQRVGIARALALEPKVVICDEATSALDVSVQQSIIELLVRLQKEKGLSIGFICHDLALVQQFAHQIAIMYLGTVVEVMNGKEICTAAKHPYTQALLDSVFDLEMDFSKDIVCMDSEIPSPINIPAGCPFQNRCKSCLKICKEQRPRLTAVNSQHLVACHLYSDTK